MSNLGFEKLIISYLVVKPKPEFWHAGQVDTHLDCPHNFRPQNVARGSSQKVDALDDIQENFVLSVSKFRGSNTDI